MDEKSSNKNIDRVVPIVHEVWSVWSSSLRHTHRWVVGVERTRDLPTDDERPLISGCDWTGWVVWRSNRSPDVCMEEVTPEMRSEPLRREEGSKKMKNIREKEKHKR